MKLLQRAGLYYLWFSTLIFVIGGGTMFLVIRFIINFETDERLRDGKIALQSQLAAMEALPALIIVSDEVIEITPANHFNSYQQFVDTLHWNPVENEYEPYRKLSYHDQINGRPYLIALNHSRLDDDELMINMMLIALGILGLLLVGINLFNRFISLRIWSPFYRIIQQIKGFSFDKMQPLLPPRTNIDEFIVLHRALERMTGKVLSDYSALKQFAENASTEIQIPLAAIKEEIELLNGQQNWNENERLAVKQIQEAATRLSDLNQSLLLLTRIENRQFTNTRELNFKKLIEDKLTQFEPLLSEKKLKVTAQLSPVRLWLDPALAEVLLNNLLGNAIKHNIPNGTIEVVLEEKWMHFRNTGDPLKVPPEELFERFRKGTEAAPSQGLGLAIVKEICLSYGFDIKYTNDNGWHKLTVFF